MVSFANTPAPATRVEQLVQNEATSLLADPNAATPWTNLIQRELGPSFVSQWGGASPAAPAPTAPAASLFPQLAATQPSDLGSILQSLGISPQIAQQIGGAGLLAPAAEFGRDERQRDEEKDFDYNRAATLGEYPKLREMSAQQLQDYIDDLQKSKGILGGNFSWEGLQNSLKDMIDPLNLATSIGASAILPPGVGGLLASIVSAGRKQHDEALAKKIYDYTYGPGEMAWKPGGYQGSTAESWEQVENYVKDKAIEEGIAKGDIDPRRWDDPNPLNNIF